MKRLWLIAFLLFQLTGFGQAVQRPKLVVGLVVDQMRWDYLYRFYDRYGNGGFKRLLQQGFSCENTLIPYTPTYTAPGHACVYTGSVPALNGIVGNNWWDKRKKQLVYCTDDSTVRTVGSNSPAGLMSPRNLFASTITDELRLATNFQNKTIAIALKDRGSILPGGHTANASYWFDNASGGWISSTFYMNQLPQWVQAFNARKLPDSLLRQPWETLYPLATYRQSTSDSNAFEGRLPGEDGSFPHQTAGLSGVARYETFRYLPAANTYTLEMAKEAVRAEHLGQRAVTDFLAISLSSTDYVGHAFGPNSIEVEDMYLRLDADLAKFLAYLDASVGKGQYLLFLTADHGAAHNSRFAQSQRLPGGVYEGSKSVQLLEEGLEKAFGVRGLIARNINYQLHLNDSLLQAKGIDRKKVKEHIARLLLQQPAVSQVLDLEDLDKTPIPEKLKTVVRNGYQPQLSGDLHIVFKPGWSEGFITGTTHGLWNAYDAHIPLLWYGWNVKPGKLHREVYMTDIAPTIGALLHIQMPNASVGAVIGEVFGEKR